MMLKTTEFSVTITVVRTPRVSEFGKPLGKGTPIALKLSGTESRLGDGRRRDPKSLEDFVLRTGV